MKIVVNEFFKVKIIFHHIYFFFLLLFFESCAFTWIGRSVGGDIGRPRFDYHPDSRIIKVSPEKINYGGRNHVEVYKNDSNVIKGRFMGFKAVPEIYYAAKFHHFFDTTKNHFPEIGEKLVISSSSLPRRTISGIFIGFVNERIQIKTDTNEHTLLLHNITSISDTAGKKFNVETINKMLNQNQNPLRSGVIIHTSTLQKIIVPLEDIAYVRCQKGERNGKRIGMAVGMLIDLSIVMVKSRDVIDDSAMEINF